MIDQCPTSAKEGKPVLKPRSAHELVGTSGQAYYRGLDDLADTADFRDFLEREFPAGASEMLSGSRRTFLKLMGASVALAGVASMPGCRRPDHQILPYSKNVPEDVVAGRPLYYATAMPLPGGGAEGLLVETHEGRPTKVEGNPLHPVNQGKSSVWAQASVLEMYDPERLKDPTIISKSGEATSGWPFIAGWANEACRVVSKREGETDEAFKKREADEAKVWAEWNQPGHFNKFDKNGGEGLVIVADKRTSPTRDRLRDKLLAKWPKATWVVWDSANTGVRAEATAAAFGKPMRDVLDLAKASVIVSFDRDFLQHEAGSLSHARGWGASRRVLKAGQAMSRLYVVESSNSITGASADHRLRLAPSQIPAVVVAVAKRVIQSRAVRGSEALAAAVGNMNPTLEGDAAHYADEIAKDLLNADNLGKSVVVAGETQPAWVHGVCLAINAALGNIGKTMGFAAMGKDEAAASMTELSKCVDLLNGGKVDTLVCLEVNPAFDATGDLPFGEVMKKAAHRVVLSTEPTETTAHATVRLNAAHYLESWGDATANDGTSSITQPMIAPLYNGKTQIELLAMILGEKKIDGHELVRATWRERVGKITDGEFEKRWKRFLHDGVAEQAAAAAAPNADFAALAKLASGGQIAKAPTESSLDVVFVAGMMRDGRFINNAWMQELPDSASKIVWDNAAYVSPRTAEKLGIMQTPEIEKKPAGRMVELKSGARTVKIAVWAVPGMPDNTVALPTGYGRRVTNAVGAGTGFDVSPLRDSKSAWVLSGVSLSKVENGEKYYEISCTQTHGSMEGRAIVREIDKPAWDKFGENSIETKTDSYGRPQKMTLGERLEGGELNHMPALVPVYQDPNRNREVGYNASRANHPTPGKAAYDSHPQWGMTIDLSSCIGCNVCTVACQSENNIPVVGKIEVNKGRNMHWIRVDRYFKGDLDASDGTVFQPVACVHCEAAPCEVVCPVNATVHGSEGHNFMVYNRCIGTRYCANNCPYKVRRFNFFDYGVVKFQGGLKESIEEITGKTVSENLPANHNLIPPRLRKQLDEITKLQKNPNVTVRSRGVMEKCSYCIQRTNEAKIDYKLATGKRPEDFMPDGLVQTACQQACPTGAITFGNILDKTGEYTDADGSKRTGSLVHNMREHTRSYLLLGFLSTRPRTSHMIRVNNPNVDLLAKLGKKARLARIENPFGSHGGHGGGHGTEGGEHGKPHAPAGETKHSFVDPAKTGRDGYVLSLGVLPGSGVHA